MRISIEYNDPGYDRMQDLIAQRNQITVLFNDFRVSRCIMADEEMGEVKFYISDARGNPVRNEQTGEAWIHTALGSVEIELM